MGKPTLFLIAGPNGAGKSTFYDNVLKHGVNAPFINADLIQRDELQDPSMQAAYTAADIAAERRRQCLAQGRDFVSETTFSHPSKLELLREARAAGFRIIIFHISVASAELSVRRVECRVEEGGHPVPEQKIRERYARNQELIRQAVLAADRAFVYDNSALNRPAALAIEFDRGRVVRRASHIPAWAGALYEQALRWFQGPA